jgi:hypothetical protein
MKRTPRYVRLGVLGLSLVALGITKSYEHRLSLDLGEALWLDPSEIEKALTPYLFITQLTPLMTFLPIALTLWLFAPQERKSN